MGSMNGEVRIWDVRAPEKPLYESVAQSHGLAGLAVHAGAPVLATYAFLTSRRGLNANIQDVGTIT
jgi:regulator-associated protein of mTOR